MRPHHRRRVLRTGLVATSIWLAAVASACSSSSPEVPVGADGAPDAELVVGREVYESRCANCHGASGGGGTGPRLADGAVIDNYPDPADQLEIIAEGRGQMPSFSSSLDADELDAVVRYTREVL